MAERFVEFLLNKLGDFLVQKIFGDGEINDDLVWLKNELSMIKAFLRDADRQSSRTETAKEWVSQLKRTAFRIEDVLDDFCDKELSYVSLRWKFSREFPTIKEEVESIKRNGRGYGLLCEVEGGGETSSGSKHSKGKDKVLQIYGASFEEPEMVGFDIEMTRLREYLLREEHLQRHNVISIVGLAGSGKSTVARNAYNLLVKDNFDCCAWVFISKSFQIKDILTRVHKGFCQSTGDPQPSDMEIENKDETELKSKIYKFLLGKSYALFLDDMCDLSVWNAIKSALPCDGRSKIIFISPFMHSFVNENCHLLIINSLSHESAWELFCQKAFQYSNPPGVCPEYLIDLGKAIVEKCGGLPLAILLMGGVMSNKRSTPIEWKDVLDNFYHSSKSLNQILEASYDELSSELKYCFLYCCTFPRSSKIKRNKVIQLWVAEGFIENKTGTKSEDVANDYYVQLVQRCFLQPIVSDFDGEPVACEVHHIMREFAKSRFQEEFGILGGGQYHQFEHMRRLAIHDSEKKIVADGGQCFKIRSLLVFSGNEFPFSPLNKIPKMFKYLRVLSLEGIPIESLPDEVYDLFFLRYLGLRGTWIETLSSSLSKLENLETLDIRDTRIRHLPSIVRLRGLKHLLLRKMKIYGNDDLIKIRKQNIPRQLLTLLGVEIYNPDPVCEDWSQVRRFEFLPLGSLSHCVELQRLHINIWNVNPWRVRAFLSSLVSLRTLKLYFLKIDSDGKRQFGFVNFEDSLQPPRYLEKLVLGGVMQQLPQWFSHLKSLRIIRLVNSLLVADPLGNLALLPNLVSLSLYHAYVGEEMGCEQGGFPKLRHLHLASLVEFREWSAIEKGTMPCLKFLSIVDCTKLRMLPQGFEQLKSLQSLEIIEMPDEFMERLMTEDHFKINHISKIFHVPRTGVMTCDSQESPFSGPPPLAPLCPSPHPQNEQQSSDSIATASDSDKYFDVGPSQRASTSGSAGLCEDI